MTAARPTAPAPATAASIPTSAFCARCNTVTPTTLIVFRPDLIANACSICRACRRLKPWVSKKEFREFKPALMGDAHKEPDHATRSP